MENIFDDSNKKEVAQPDRHDTRGKQTEKAIGLAKQFHSNTHQETGGEPDWNRLLLEAEGGIAKMKVREAKDLWQQEQRWKAHLEQQAAQQERIDQVKKTPNRNQAFYSELQKNDPRSYWSTDIQRQMRADKAALGLYWHMKK